MAEYNLSLIAGGTVQEQFDRAMQAVLENIADESTSDSAARKIVINFKLTPKDDRTRVQCEAFVDKKLVHSAPTMTGFEVMEHYNGEITAEEWRKQSEGQMSFNHATDINVGNTHAVDESTGELINFKEAVGG